MKSALALIVCSALAIAPLAYTPLTADAGGASSLAHTLRQDDALGDTLWKYEAGPASSTHEHSTVFGYRFGKNGAIEERITILYVNRLPVKAFGPLSLKSASGLKFQKSLDELKIWFAYFDDFGELLRVDLMTGNSGLLNENTVAGVVKNGVLMHDGQATEFNVQAALAAMRKLVFEELPWHPVLK